MAIARLSVKVGKAGKAAPHAEYIDRDEKKKKKAHGIQMAHEFHGAGFGKFNPDLQRTHLLYIFLRRIRNTAGGSLALLFPRGRSSIPASGSLLTLPRR